MTILTMGGMMIKKKPDKPDEPEIKQPPILPERIPGLQATHTHFAVQSRPGGSGSLFILASQAVYNGVSYPCCIIRVSIELDVTGSIITRINGVNAIADVPVQVPPSGYYVTPLISLTMAEGSLIARIQINPGYGGNLDIFKIDPDSLISHDISGLITRKDRGVKTIDGKIALRP